MRWCVDSDEPIRDLLMLAPFSVLGTFAVRTLAGGLSGGLAIAIFNPVDVAKTQMMDSSGRTRPMLQVLGAVVRARGLLGLWAGLLPNIVRCFLVNAAELGTYDETIEALQGWVDSQTGQHVLAAGVAALAAAVVSTPVDVAKTRLMKDAAGEKDKAYSSMTDAWLRIYMEEGLTALYSGFCAIVCLKVAWCVVFFHTYAELQTLSQALSTSNK